MFFIIFSALGSNLFEKISKPRQPLLFPREIQSNESSTSLLAENRIQPFIKQKKIPKLDGIHSLWFVCPYSLPYTLQPCFLGPLLFLLDFTGMT